MWCLLLLSSFWNILIKVQVFYFSRCSKFICHKYKQMYSWLIEYANYAQSLLLHNYFFATIVCIDTFLLPRFFNAEFKRQCRWPEVLFIHFYVCICSYMWVYIHCRHADTVEARIASVPLELELQVVMSFHMNFGIWT